MQKEIKRPITQTLKAMEKEDVEIFPKFQYGSVNTCLQRIAYETGKKFRINRKQDGVRVTRLA